MINRKKLSNINKKNILRSKFMIPESKNDICEKLAKHCLQKAPYFQYYIKKIELEDLIIIYKIFMKYAKLSKFKFHNKLEKFVKK